MGSKRRIYLHLSHTDIEYDSRILKEIAALSTDGHAEVIGIGVRQHEGSSSGESSLNARIVSMALITRFLHFFPRPMRYALNMLELTLRMMFYGLRFRPTVVHCHDTLALPAGVFIKPLLGCKLVYDAHELESNKNGQTRMLSSATLRIEKWAWKQVDLLVSVSDSILEWYGTHLGLKASVLVLNAPQVSQLGPGPQQVGAKAGYFHDRFGIPADKCVFLYLGIFSPGRGIELCLRVFSDADVDAHVVFMGYGPLATEIEAATVQSEKIHVHEAVPHERVVTMAQSADVGLCFVENVSLSDYYSLPNKLFEYAFAGLPVLASDFPEISKLVAQHALGRCAALDVSSIKTAVLQYVDGDDVPVAHDLDDLSWAAQAKRLNEAYHQLLEGRIDAFRPEENLNG